MYHYSTKNNRKNRLYCDYSKYKKHSSQKGTFNEVSNCSTDISSWCSWWRLKVPGVAELQKCQAEPPPPPPVPTPGPAPLHPAWDTTGWDAWARAPVWVDQSWLCASVNTRVITGGEPWITWTNSWKVADSFRAGVLEWERVLGSRRGDSASWVGR